MGKSDAPMVKVDGYHGPLEVEFTVDTDDVVELNPAEHEFNFRKAGFVELDAYLRPIDWDIVMSMRPLTVSMRF